MAETSHQDGVSSHGASDATATFTVPSSIVTSANVDPPMPTESNTQGFSITCPPGDTPRVESSGFDHQTLSPSPKVTVQMVDDSKKSDKIPLQLMDQTNLLPFRKILPVFMGLATCVVVSALDSVIVATAMPTISASFNAGSIASWVPSAYLLASTSCQPLYGRFSDIFGRKWVLCASMMVYMLGCLVAGFSTSIIQLIICRGVAGAGGGGIQSMAQIIVSDIVSLRERGKYQGIITFAIALGFAIGPLAGGALAQNASWRWCFWVTVPIALFATCIVFFVLPLKPVQGSMKEKLLAIDYLGIILTLGGSVLIILPLVWGGVTYPWNSPIVLGLLCSGVVVIPMFCLWEWKGARLPIVPMYIFKETTVTGVSITMFINGFVFLSSLYYLPQLFQIASDYSPVQSGVFLLPMLIGQMFASWSSGVLVSRTGNFRTSIYVGFSIWAVGCGLLSTVTASTTKALIVVYMLLAGLGAGQTLSTTTVAAQASVSRRDMSVATAVRNFMRRMGQAFSVPVGSALVNNAFRTHLSSLSLSPSAIDTIINDPTVLSPNTPPSKLASLGLTSSTAQYALSYGYTSGFRSVFILNACLSAFAAIIAFLLIQHKELIRGDEDKLKEEALVALQSGEDKLRIGAEKV